MKKPPKRTHATSLSDSQLLLFDFLFDTSLSFHHMRAEAYSLYMNCSYSHGLDDAELESTLNKLIRQWPTLVVDLVKDPSQAGSLTRSTYAKGAKPKRNEQASENELTPVACQTVSCCYLISSSIPASHFTTCEPKLLASHDCSYSHGLDDAELTRL